MTLCCGQAVSEWWALTLEEIEAWESHCGTLPGLEPPSPAFVSRSWLSVPIPSLLGTRLIEIALT